MVNNPQKDYIDKVSNIAINPLQCSNNYFNQTIKKYTPGKRYNLEKYPLKDYLSVASNQIIFELDAKGYNSNFKLAKKIIPVLETRQIPYYIFSSGGKGLHIEIWFDKPKFINNEIKKLFKESLSYNLSFKHIRLWLWNKILDDAGISEDLRGIGKVVDSACMIFDDLNDKTRLIRVVGGRKIHYDKTTDDEHHYYKTYIQPHKFNSKQIKLKNFDDVEYPLILKSFEIDENEFGEFLDNFVNNAKNNNVRQLKKINLSKDGGYINLDSVKRIREGMKKGQRAMGAQILAIAMANDKLEDETKKTIMIEYVNACSQIGDVFNEEEAMGWVKWVDVQSDIYWNCGLVENLGVHDSSLCEHCKKNYKEANEFLTKSNMLFQIKEVLDEEVVGENDIKILMFLLTLSKNFPSKTGTPDWNIKGDPMSQNIILASDSASGKSYITKAILELTGEKDKDYFIISRMTKNAINYYTEQNMDGKIIFIEEMQGLDENTSQLRVWMSEGELNLDTIEKVKDDEGVEVNTKITKKTQGQPVFISNQAEGKIEEQLNNRSWIMSLDVTQQQTEKILEYQDMINKCEFKNNELKKRKIYDALKQLKPYHFIVPFADRKLLNIPAHDIRARRDYEKLLTLIKCSTYLHQMQRDILEDDNGNKYLVCDLKDYEIAKTYAHSILGATFSGLTNSQIDLLNFLRKSSWKDDFQISDIMRNLGKSQPHWFTQLKQLEDLGHVTVDRSAGKTGNYSLNEYKITKVINLPDSKDLQAFTQTTYKSIKSRLKMVHSTSLIGEGEFDEKTAPTNEITYKGFKDDAIIAKTSETEQVFCKKRGQIYRLVTPEIVLNFIKNHTENAVDIIEIVEKLKNDEIKEEDVYSLIEKLIKEGKLHKIKNGKVMIL